MKILAVLFGSLLPAFAFAQQIDATDGLFRAIESLISIVLPILYAVAVLFVIFKLVTWILAKGDEKSSKLKELGYSLLFLFVLFSITGIIALLQETVNVDTNDNINVPGLNIQPGTINVGN